MLAGRSSALGWPAAFQPSRFFALQSVPLFFLYAAHATSTGLPLHSSPSLERFFNVSPPFHYPNTQHPAGSADAASVTPPGFQHACMHFYAPSIPCLLPASAAVPFHTFLPLLPTAHTNQ